MNSTPPYRGGRLRSGPPGNVLERLADRLDDALARVRVRPEVDYWPEAMRAAVDRLAARADEKPRNASLSIDGAEAEVVEAGFVLEDGAVSVTEGRIGRKIAADKLLAEMEGGLFEGCHEYEAPIVQDKPDLTTAEAERLKPTTVLGDYEMDYTWDTDPGRRINMESASEAISGSVVAPGGIFSYNAVTEPLDYEESAT